MQFGVGVTCVTMYSKLHGCKVQDLGQRMMGVGHRCDVCSGLSTHYKIFDIFGQSSGEEVKKKSPVIKESEVIGAPKGSRRQIFGKGDHI